MRSSSKRYLIILTLAVTVGASTIALLNWRVDPNDIFMPPHSWRIQGLHRTGNIRHVPTIKVKGLRRRAPSHLILGHSRASVFDPAQVWPRHSSSSYNAAVGGASMQDLLNLYKLARSLTIPQEALLIVDLAAFHRGHRTTQRFHPLDIATETSLRTQTEQISLLLGRLLSIDMLHDSIATLLRDPAQQPCPSRTITPNGWVSDWDCEIVAKEGSTHNAFVRYARSHRKMLDRLPPEETFELEPSSNGATQMDAMAKLLDLLYSDHCRTRIVISPLHSKLRTMEDSLGFAPIREKFHLNLRRLNREIARQYGAKAFPIRNFNLPSALTDERWPSEEQADYRLQFWMEPTHFNAAAANEIIRWLKSDGQTSTNQ